MSDDIRPEVVRRTQDTLGKYIKKPPLSEKLLKKPPFRFLHDIITAVIRETGFLQGLFSAEELNHETIKDRDSKIAFLQKVIDAVKVITGTNLTVRPVKIISGHEPSKTNELLQEIGKALDKKLSSLEYVESLQKAGKKPKPTSKATKETKPTSQVRTQADRTRTKVQDRKKTNKLSTKSSVKQPVQEAPQPTVKEVPEDNMGGEAQAFQVKEPDLKRPHSARRGHRQSSASTPSHTAADLGAPEGLGGDSSEKTEILLGGEDKTQILDSPQPVEVQLLGADTLKMEPDTGVPNAPVPRSALPQTGVRPRTALRPASARPHSARPAAPRVRDRGEVRPTEESSSTVKGRVNVITESAATVEQDEDASFVVVESQTNNESVTSPPLTDTKPLEEGRHGHLVAQILETQKELEDDSHRQSQDSQPRKVHLEWEVGRRRERESVGREIERLRCSIQILTRAANPLGKLMDFLQEDVDSMQRELSTWRHTNMELMAQLHMEHSHTQQLTEPMRVHLQHLQQSIQEQLGQLSTLKATVLRNDQHIQSLLTGKAGAAQP